MPKNKEQVVRIATLIPTRGLIFTEVINAVLRENGFANQYPALFTTTDLPIPQCRNALVEDALKHEYKFTHFLFIDEDVILPEGGLNQMIDLDVDVAFIDYPMHYAVGKWKNMSTACRDNWLPGEKWRDKPIVWAGMGCVLVKREVLEKIDKPWFEIGVKSFIRDSKTGKVNISNQVFNDGEGGGEDVNFFKKVKEQKFSISEVKGVYAGHARVEKYVLVMQRGKYRTQHKIKINDKVDQPYK